MSDKYISWDNKTINDFSDDHINTLYDQGYVFTRLGLGQMSQTRSIRVNLDKFIISSENKRILKKTGSLTINTVNLPHPNYNWQIHKLGHCFYSVKFGDKTFSANKIKKLLTEKDNFNLLIEYKTENITIGYCIAYYNNYLLHYSYPFYDLSNNMKNIGIGMMTKAIVWAKEKKLKYVYLGSARDIKSVYKLQFSGVEWYDGNDWSGDINKLKKILTEQHE